MQPTDKMINFARIISEILKIDLPDLTSYQVTHQFINDNADEYWEVVTVVNDDMLINTQLEDIKHKYKLELDIDNFIAKLNKINKVRGVYLLWSGNNLVYIGKSKNLRNRIISSIYERTSDKLPITAVTPIQTITEADMHILEPLLISEYKPILNSEFSCSDYSNHFKSNMELSEMFRNRILIIKDELKYFEEYTF
jgi:hypothetical protein